MEGQFELVTKLPKSRVAQVFEKAMMSSQTYISVNKTKEVKVQRLLKQAMRNPDIRNQIEIENMN